MKYQFGDLWLKNLHGSRFTVTISGAYASVGRKIGVGWTFEVQQAFGCLHINSSAATCCGPGSNAVCGISVSVVDAGGAVAAICLDVHSFSYDYVFAL
jgi:hypothetical protein